MSACSIGLLLLAAAGFAWAQQRLPTDTELHAAACIPMMKWAVSVSQQILAASPKDPGEAEFLERKQAEARKSLEESQSALERLRAYLIPRLSTLDTLAIAAATKRGDADVQELRNFLDQCNACVVQAAAKNPAKPDYASCKLNECKRPLAQDRLDSCKNPSWFPF